MKLYQWNSFERRFLPVPVQEFMPREGRVRLTSLQVEKGERVNSEAISGEQMICLLHGSWQMNIGDNDLVVHRDEAVIIPSGVTHSAEAIEDSFALQIVREREIEEDCLWGV